MPMKIESTTVALQRCDRYAPRRLEPVIRQLLAAIGPLPDLAGATVLLKPNLISTKNGGLPCTDGAFILAVARRFLALQARVLIGDSPAFGRTTTALDRIGVLGELLRLGVKVCDFVSTVQVKLPSGVQASLARQVMECDFLVNLPRIKAHAQLLVTLGVKNLFGCLVGLRKPWWHMVHGGERGRFVDLLADLVLVVPDGITLADGITAMHCTGPTNGEPYPLGLLAASANPVALDTAMLSVLNIEHGASPLWQVCRRRRMAGTEPDGLCFPLLSPRQVTVRDFQVPERLNPIRFSGIRFVKGLGRRMRPHLFFP